MVVGLVKKKIGKRFDGELRFVRGMIEGPKQVGAILPTSSVTAKVMASVINPDSGLKVLELGPGTGAITKAILNRVPAERLVSIEYSTPFYNHLTATFPGVNFINGDAFDLDRSLGQLKDETFDCIISAIPLLNFPMQARIALVESLLARILAGRPMVQISYGPISPVAAKPESYTIRHLDFVVRNIPPAQLWTYTKHA
jgi:phosphatidylethanolamine/phosphatidyl-N-methylethanolamine N-methyltransferase